jgi:hypothetical protein
MNRMLRHALLFAAALLVSSSAAEAGPPLICHPFQTSSSALLPWGSGPGWNTPDTRYDLQRLIPDTLAILDTETAVLTRMENMRRAVIYATRDRRVAERLLTEVVARATAPNAGRLARFDAGYLIESYRQATHLFGQQMTTQDGYQMVLRAIAMGMPNPEMEFAAALMTSGQRSAAHLERVRQAAGREPLLAENLTRMGW